MTATLASSASLPRLSRRRMLFGVAIAALGSAVVSCAGRVAAPGPVSAPAAVPTIAVQSQGNIAGVAQVAAPNGVGLAPALTPVASVDTSGGIAGSAVTDNVAPIATAAVADAPTATAVAQSVAITNTAPTATVVTTAPQAVAATPTTAPAVIARPTAIPATAVPAPATTVVIQMTDQYKFAPSNITISRGTTVEWKDAGTQPHTITCDPAKAMNKANVAFPSGAQPFDSGFIMGGQAYKHTFTVAGVYRYICVPHEMMGMVGTIVVT